VKSTTLKNIINLTNDINQELKLRNPLSLEVISYAFMNKNVKAAIKEAVSKAIIDNRGNNFPPQ